MEILNFLQVGVLIMTFIFLVVLTIGAIYLVIEDVFFLVEYIRKNKSAERLKKLFERGKKNGKE